MEGKDTTKNLLTRELGKVFQWGTTTNNSLTYSIYDSNSSKIVSSRNVTFIEQVENNTPSSTIGDTTTNEGRISSEDFDKPM